MVNHLLSIQEIKSFFFFQTKVIQILNLSNRFPNSIQLESFPISRKKNLSKIFASNLESIKSLFGKSQLVKSRTVKKNQPNTRNKIT